MEYSLQVKEKTIFGFGRTGAKVDGFVEYFDKNNPFGLLKLNFSMLSLDPMELNLINAEHSGAMSDEDCLKAVETFEEIEKSIIEKGVLPKSAVVTGIQFYSNSSIRIQDQSIRFHISPNAPRFYTIRILRGSKSFLRTADAVISKQRKQDGKKKPFSKPKHQHNQPHQQKETPVQNVPNKEHEEPIPDNTMEVAANLNVEVGEIEDSIIDFEPPSQLAPAAEDAITLTTDTGISENFQQSDFDAVTESLDKAANE